MKTNVKVMLGIALLAGGTFLTSCEKDEHVKPDMSFKTGGSYVSDDMIVGLQDTFVVGVVVEKTEDELKLFNVSVMYDGSSTSNTLLTDTLSGAEEDHYDADVTIVTRNVAGTEHYSFTVTDMDGNIATKELHITVQ